MDVTRFAGKHNVGDGSAWRRLAWWFPAAAVALLVARRAIQVGDLPTGPDGGAWLAIGRGMLGGPGRDTAGAYAPLIPTTVAGFAGVLGAVEAVRFVGIAAWAVLLAAIWFVVPRRAGPVVAGAAVVAAGGASAVAEPLFFGGYPQLVATAALLVALWSLARWLGEGNARALAVGTVALGIAAASHHVYGALALAAGCAAGLIWFITTKPAMPEGRSRGVGLAAATLCGAAILAPTMAAFRAAGYEPPLDAARFEPGGAWAYATREAPLVWATVAIAGTCCLWASRTKPTPGWLAASALLLVAGPAMVVSAEPRLAPAVLIASVVGIANVLPANPPGWLAGALSAGALALALAGDRAADAYAAFYRVLDRSLVESATAIEATAPSGLVAVQADRRGWPVGWWYEGLTDRRIAVGSDPRWLGFPGERERAALVAELFAPGRNGNDLRRVAESAGVEVLVARKWEWIGWDRWLSDPDPVVTVVFDDDEVIVLRLVPGNAMPEPAAENAGV